MRVQKLERLYQGLQSMKHIDGAAIVGENCMERDGKHYRTAFYVEPTSELLDLFWSKMQGIPTMVSNVPLKHRSQLDVLLDPTVMMFLIDDVGVVVFKFESSAMLHMHVTFWDRRLRGRDKLIKKLCALVLKRAKADKIMTFIPASSKAVITHAKRAGFQITGWGFGTTIDRKGFPEDQLILAFMG